jgi:uncharacterized protein (DUF1501 family)
MKHVHPDRRDVLRGAAAGAAGFLGAGLAAHPVLASARRRDDAESVLVLVQLGGGNDGLSMLVPYADDAYARSRAATRIESERVLRLDDRAGLHPNLPGLKARFDAGELAVVPGCGYPRPNRSHFKSMEIWQAADHRGRAAGAGWIGRLCDVAFRESHPARLVHVGGTTPFSLYSARHGTASFVVPEGYRWVENEDSLASYDDAVGGASTKNDRLAFLRGVLTDARESSRAVRAAAASYRPTVRYPEDAFAYDLRAAAAVIHGGLGTRVVSTTLTGFDTHSGQRATHDELMRRLDIGLSAFLADLSSSSIGKNTVVLAFSEFGRRVAENGSRGTDHGTAGPMLVAGARVKGGLHGKHPSLTELDAGDLVHTTDFRSVYGAAIEGCFGVRASDVLGAEYPRLALL